MVVSNRKVFKGVKIFLIVRKKNINLYSVITNNLFDNLVYGNGLNMFILDTGIFIDLEQYCNNNGKLESPASLLSLIEKDYPLLVTTGVMKEIKNHREEIKVKTNNRAKISESTAILAYNLYKETKDLDLCLSSCDLFKRDYHRLGVRLASAEVFRNDPRKEKKKISEVDMEIVYTALDLCKRNYMGKSIGSVNILTTDSDISKTVSYLKKPIEDNESIKDNELNCMINSSSFNDYEIRAINIRKNLSSYMSK